MCVFCVSVCVGDCLCLYVFECVCASHSLHLFVLKRKKDHKVGREVGRSGRMGKDKI